MMHRYVSESVRRDARVEAFQTTWKSTTSHTAAPNRIEVGAQTRRIGRAIMALVAAGSCRNHSRRQLSTLLSANHCSSCEVPRCPDTYVPKLGEAPSRRAVCVRGHGAASMSRAGADGWCLGSRRRQVPRMWLFGYDEDGTPLRPAQVFEDMSADHAKKTVTLDPHPHLAGPSHASVHPCRHSVAIKRIIDMVCSILKFSSTFRLGRLRSA
uniref:Autophagy-related protein 3 n=1 Tax=Cryptomonas curvata TaxID=233186 RepID=A0A7S0N553_9CRYP|mmetsp:Transcript_60323/g.126228  ORF Transcript_60323/g.126228 Transcript_60323/m.126228 type:complete len:211 (+) Transcript_60323:287-919(+)